MMDSSVSARISLILKHFLMLTLILLENIHTHTNMPVTVRDSTKFMFKFKFNLI